MFTRSGHRNGTDSVVTEDASLENVSAGINMQILARARTVHAAESKNLCSIVNIYMNVVQLHHSTAAARRRDPINRRRTLRTMMAPIEAMRHI